jgi:hypothetical protein
LAGKRSKGTELAVLKVRKADLTHAMLQILSNEALIKYDLHQQLIKQGFTDTRYDTVKKKIKILEETCCLKQVGVRKTQPGSEGILHQATFKALASLKLSIISLEDLFEHMDEETVMELLALLTR